MPGTITVEVDLSANLHSSSSGLAEITVILSLTRSLVYGVCLFTKRRRWCLMKDGSLRGELKFTLSYLVHFYRFTDDS